MAWTRITDDPATLPPIGEIVFLCNGAMGWQGKRIAIEGRVYWQECYGSTDWWRDSWECHDMDSAEYEATHWHPLPALPESEGTE